MKYYKLQEAAQFVSNNGLANASDREISDALKKAGLLSPNTFIRDVNYDTLRRAACDFASEPTLGTLIDSVETSKRRVALHLLKVPPHVLSNELIAHAFGWTVDQLLDFYRQDNPSLVVRQ